MATLDPTVQLKAIQDAIVVESGIPDARVMWSDGNVPQADYPYVSINVILEVDGSPYPHQRQTFDVGDDELDVELAQHQRLTLSVGVFADSNAPTSHARYLASLIRTGLRKPSTLLTLDQADLGMVSISDTRDLSETIKGLRRTRAQIDVVLSTVRVYTDVAIPYIGTVDWEFDLGLGGSPDDSGTYNLP